MDNVTNVSATRETATTTDNVRSRVSVWLSGIVDEVRKKSPARIQKWTEFTESVPSSDAERNENTPKNISGCSKGTSVIPVLNEQSDGNINLNAKANESVFQPSKIWRAEGFLNKVRESNLDASLLSVGGIKSIGRVKISEFYDKVRTNKGRLNRLPERKNMDQLGLNISESDLSDPHMDVGAEDVLSSTRNSFHSTKEDISLNENLEISESDEISFNANRKIPLGAIGRSSTSGSYGSSINPVQTYQQRQPPKSPILSSIAQKHLLGNIGRSFSEQTDDENDSSFMFNERSRSYSHEISEGQAIPNPSDSDNNNVSSSLPTFFGRKSVPVSPVPQYRGSISREASLSDSSRRKSLLRDSSVQSDSSHCSSVESLLEARKPDPEAILISLGFGPVHSEDVLSKIPKRFLKPSQVKGIDIDTFLRQQQMASHLHDHSVLGYRGLLGNPDIPPSLIVAKIMERFEQNERNRCIMDINLNRPQSAPPTPGPNQ